MVAGVGSIAATTDAEEFVGEVYALDPTLTGERRPADASRSLLSLGAGVSGAITSWDGDGDGIAELIAGEDIAEAVLRFASPWVGDLTPDDAVTVWQGDPADELGVHDLRGLADLTGDGLGELGMSAATRDDPVERAGALYVVEGGDLASGPAEDVAIQLHGTRSVRRWVPLSPPPTSTATGRSTSP